MESFSKYFAVSGNCFNSSSGYYDLNDNNDYLTFSITLSTNDVPDFYIVESALIYLKHRNYYSDAHNIKLYLLEDNQEKLIDYAIKRDVDYERLVFDVTPLFFKNKRRTYSFKIKYSGSNHLYEIESGSSDHRLYLECVKEESLSVIHPSLSKNVSGRLSYSLNLVSGSYSFAKSLPNDVLKYDLSLVYDCKSEDTFAFLPKSWKLSILEKIIINRNNNNEIVSIDYIDSFYKRHSFVIDSDSSPYFYDNSGTGLVIEPVTGGYKLFNGISVHGYKKFNSDGYIVEIKDAYNRSIAFDYYLSQFILQSGDSGSSIAGTGDGVQFIDPPGPIDPIVVYKYIDILDYDGHIVRIKQAFNSSTKVYIDIYENQTALNNNTSLYSYELNVASGYLSSIKENSNSLTYVDYNNSHQITSMREYTGYEFYLSYLGEKPETIIHKYSLDVVDKYSIDYQVKRIIAKDYHNIGTAYVYSNLYSKGVMVSDELLSNYGYISYVTERFVSFPVNGRVYDLQNTLLNNQFNTTNLGDGLTIQNGKKYIAIIRLIKASDQDDNPIIPTEIKTDLKLTIEYSLGVTEDIYLASYSKKKDFVFVYQANSSFNPVFTVDTGNYPNPLALYIYLFEYKEEYKDGCFFTKNSIDYFISANSELLLNGNNCYKDDVFANKVFTVFNSPLRWANKKRKLINDSSLASYQYQENNETMFNLSIFNTIFKFKTIIKTIDDDVTRYPVYSVSYLEYSGGYFVFYTDKHIDNEMFQSIQKYDPLFRLVEEENDEGIKVSYEYSDDNIISQTTSNANGTLNSKTESSYDTKDRLTEQIRDRYFINNVLSITYQNSYLSAISITKNTTNTTNYLYDSSHLKVEELSVNSFSSISYNYSYDNLTEFNNDSYFRYSYGDYNLLEDFSIKTGNSYQSIVSVFALLDEDGDDVTVDYANGFEKRTYFYKYGNINYIAHGNQVAAKYLYFNSKPDNIESLTGCDEPFIYSKLYKIIDNCSNRVFYFDYNDKGGLSSFECKESNVSTVNETLTHDLFSRLESKCIDTESSSFEIIYEYENNNSSSPCETTIVFDELSGDVQVSEEIEYNSLKRPSSIITTFNSTQRFSSEYIYPEQIVNNKKYSSLFPTRIDEYYKEGSFPQSYLHSSHISYDANGQITAIHTGDQNYGLVFTGQQYGYDNKGQLVSEINNDLGYQYVYSYDNNGNITSVAKYDLSNNLLSTDTYSYHSTYKDLLVSIVSNDNQTITTNNILYDANFNPLTIGNVSLSWTRGRLLESITIDNTQTSFSYDYLGFRTSKATGNETHKYLYDENHRLIEETISANNAIERVITYIYGLTGVIGIKVDGVLYRFEKNILNDVVAIYDEDTLIVKYVYDAYGNHVVLCPNGLEDDDPDSIGNINPIRYRSYYYDREINLYYCQSRYYYPTFRRWLNMDMISYLDTSNIRGINLFCYCKNNPVMYSDETGHSVSVAMFVGFVVASFAIGFASSVVSQGVQYGWNNINGYSFLQASIDGIFAAGSSALSFTGIGLAASVAINAIAGGVQYSIDSAFHDDFTWTGFVFAVGVSGLSAYISGPGMQNEASLNRYLDATGKAAKKAISTAYARYGYSAAYKSTVNLWGSRLSSSLTNAYIGFATESFKTSLITVPASYAFLVFASWILYAMEEYY